jgi:hypothetical protein
MLPQHFIDSFILRRSLYHGVQCWDAGRRAKGHELSSETNMNEMRGARGAAGKKSMTTAMTMTTGIGPEKQ